MPAADPLNEFVTWTRQLKGDEKGESQTFLNHLFRAFGHTDLHSSGIELEKRLKFKTGGTKFADLVWPGRVLIEMKKRGEKLDRHYRQAFDYWMYLTPTRPRWVILCNFDEFWVYDFNRQVDEPMEKIPVVDLARRAAALAFLKPVEETPVFGVNRIHVTQEAADAVAAAFNSMVKRGIPQPQAQRFILQSVVAKFSEDLGLLPKAFFTRILAEALESKDPTGTAYTLIDGLFRQMDNPKPAPAGRFKDIRYFNGGLFATVEPVAMTRDEIAKLYAAAEQDWTKVNPAIFGAIFQHSMGKEERHAFGAHYTGEADILKVVNPTIVRPWRERIEKATTAKELIALHKELQKFRVLDPACGSGNFLYVAFRELKRLETDLLLRLRAKKGKHRSAGFLSPKQFHGFDVVEFAVELAKVTLLLAKELALEEARVALSIDSDDDELELDAALPLDNLNDNIRLADALFTPWPAVDAIIGNPPFQSKNKMQKEYGPEYIQKLRAAYPKIPGRADFCVYFIRKAHDTLPPHGRAGLVGTNTIAQNESREGALDHILATGGVITDAVASQKWSGEAAVHVAIINWTKDDAPGPMHLARQAESGEWSFTELERIPASLTSGCDVTGAKSLRVNSASPSCFQGQTQGHEGFLIPTDEATKWLRAHPDDRAVMHPFLNGLTMIDALGGKTDTWVIDFLQRDILSAQAHSDLFKRLEKTDIYKDRLKAAQNEAEKNAPVLAKNPKAKVNRHHANFLAKWWLLSYPRANLMEHISSIRRYIVCVRVTKRPIFEFVESSIHPSDALTVFPLEDDYTFGILQSTLHWDWFNARCSTLEERPRYTSDTVFDSFPWPQTPDARTVRAVADAAKALRDTRRRIMDTQKWSLRDLYRAAEKHGRNDLTDAQAVLDRAVATAYGLAPKAKPDHLAFLLDLNATLFARESAGETITGPGLPPGTPKPESFVTTDCIRPA